MTFQWAQREYLEVGALQEGGNSGKGQLGECLNMKVNSGLNTSLLAYVTMSYFLWL